jgi:hypothetical protein
LREHGGKSSSSTNVESEFDLRTQSDLIMKRLHTLLLLSLVFAGSGCASMGDCCDDMACCCRDQYRSYAAWWHWKPVYSGMECGSDFGSGFREGYRGMAGGGSATAPALPPRTYWSPWYQNQYGQQQTQAWFDGYAHGTLAAEQDGVNQYSRIRTTAKPVGRRPHSNGNHNVVNNPPALPAGTTPNVEDVPSYGDEPQKDLPSLPPTDEAVPPLEDGLPPTDE